LKRFVWLSKILIVHVIGFALIIVYRSLLVLKLLFHSNRSSFAAYDTCVCAFLSWLWKWKVNVWIDRCIVFCTEFRCIVVLGESTIRKWVKNRDILKIGVIPYAFCLNLLKLCLFLVIVCASELKPSSLENSQFGLLRIGFSF